MSDIKPPEGYEEVDNTTNEIAPPAGYEDVNVKKKEISPPSGENVQPISPSVSPSTLTGSLPPNADLNAVQNNLQGNTNPLQGALNVADQYNFKGHAENFRQPIPDPTGQDILHPFQKEKVAGQQEAFEESTMSPTKLKARQKENADIIAGKTFDQQVKEKVMSWVKDEKPIPPDNSYTSGILKSFWNGLVSPIPEVLGAAEKATAGLLHVITGADAFSKDNYTSVFDKINEGANSFINNYSPGEMPNNVAGNILSGVASMPGFVVNMELSPEINLMKGVTLVPKMATYSGIMGGVENYNKTGNLNDAYEGLKDGLEQGYLFETSLGLGGKLTKGIQNSALRTLAKSGTSAAVFATQPVLSGGTSKDVIGSAILGGTLGMFEHVDPNDFDKTPEGQKNAQNRAKANSYYFSEEPKMNNAIQDMEFTPEKIKEISNQYIDVKTRQQELLKEQQEGKDWTKEKNDELLAKNMQITAIEKTVSVKAITNDIVSDPTKYIDAINADETLKEPEKQEQIAKIKGTVENSTPLKIKDLNEQAKKIQNNINYYNDPKLDIPDVTKKQKVAELQGKLDAINSQIEQEYKTPEVAEPEKTAETPEVAEPEKTAEVQDETQSEAKPETKVAEPAVGEKTTPTEKPTETPEEIKNKADRGFEEMTPQTKEEIAKSNEENIKQKFQNVADKIRKGKIDKDITLGTIPLAKDTWNVAIEIAAKTIETGGDIAQAIADAIEHLKKSDWYKKADDESKSKAEKKLSDFVKENEEKEPKEQEKPLESLNEKEPKTGGISNRKMQEVSENLGVNAPESGHVLSPEEYNKIGESLLKGGTDAEEIVKEFNKDPEKYVKEFAAVSAHTIKLQGDLNKATEDYYEHKTKENKEKLDNAKKDLAEFQKGVQPMKTAWSAMGMTMQGDYSLDLTSWSDLINKKMKDDIPTNEQVEEAKNVADKVKKEREQTEYWKNKYKEAMEKWISDKKITEKENKQTSKIIRERTDRIVKLLEKGKLSRPDVFMSATPASLVWDGALDVAIKAVKAGGGTAEAIAKAIEEGIEHIKKSEWYKNSNKKNEAEKSFSDYFKDNVIGKEETKNLKRLEKQSISLEKQLDDLRNHVIKEKKEKEPLTEEEQKITDKNNEIKEQILEEKKKLGLLPTKEMPKTDIEKNMSEAEKEEQKFKDLTERFIDKKDNKFTTDDVVDIGNYAIKEYLNKDATYEEMVRGVSMDLGLTSKQVQEALATPKNTRPILDKIYLQKRAYRQAVNSAKYFVEIGNIPKWHKIIPFTKTSIWSSFFFQKAIFAHTGVSMQTHAGPNIYDPTQWKNYFGNYIQQFRNLNKVEYEKSMENLKNKPLYALFLHGGLDIDPEKRTSEYEAEPVMGVLGKFFKSVADAGNRGFGGLKTFRYDVAESYYNGLSEIERADPKTPKMIAEMFNPATGIGETGIKESSVLGKIVKTTIFAPKLIASRWHRLLVEPFQAVQILSKGKKMSTVEKAQLKIYSKRAGIQLATMGVALAANQGILIASGSDKRVNFTDPTKPDWMRFRFGNTALDLSGGMVGTAQFVARVCYDLLEPQKNLMGKSRKEALEVALGNYAFNTISPISSSVAEPFLRHDFNGNTVPWSDEKPLYKTAHKLTWKEYLWQQAPIPAAEAAKDMYDSMYNSGVSHLSIGHILTGVMRGVIAGGTGARVMTFDKTTSSPLEQHIEQEIQRKKDKLNQTPKEKANKKIEERKNTETKIEELEKMYDNEPNEEKKAEIAKEIRNAEKRLRGTTGEVTSISSEGDYKL
jgi:hypothetical protein